MDGSLRVMLYEPSIHFIYKLQIPCWLSKRLAPWLGCAIGDLVPSPLTTPGTDREIVNVFVASLVHKLLIRQSRIPNLLR